MKQFKTPEGVERILRHFKFRPEPAQVREDFAQWRSKVGEPLELYADVYKNGMLKLYTRTGLLRFPKGKTPNIITECFEGYIAEPVELLHLFYQTRMITQPELTAAASILNLTLLQ